MVKVSCDKCVRMFIVRKNTCLANLSVFLLLALYVICFKFKSYIFPLHSLIQTEASHTMKNNLFIYRKQKLQMLFFSSSTLIAGATCIFSLICAVILGLLDKRRSKVLRLNSAESGEKVQLRDILTFPLSFWLLCVICVSYYVAIFPFIGLAK